MTAGKQKTKNKHVGKTASINAKWKNTKTAREQIKKAPASTAKRSAPDAKNVSGTVKKGKKTTVKRKTGGLQHQKPPEKKPDETLFPEQARPEIIPEGQTDPEEEEFPETGKKDTLKTYMENISRYPRISVEDEARLAKQVHSSNAREKAQAIEILIQSNLRLVVKIAHDFKGIGLPLMDLISEGNIGLMRSVEKFDPALGAKFSSYAAWWIKQSMHRALSNQTRIIRIPVQTGAKMRKIRLKREELALELGREPLNSEIAESLQFSERTVNMLSFAENRTFSLNDPVKSGENDTFEELIADPNAKSPERQISDADSIQRMKEAFKQLDEREREVLLLRFFRGKTLEEVSLIIRRTRERVRQIQNQALAKMRTLLEEEIEVVNS